MFRLLAALLIGATLALGACSNPNAVGPTYPVIGTVSQKELEKNADAARLTYYGLATMAAEYTDLPRCTATQGQPCSSQSVVNEIRRYRQIVGPATKKAVEFATSPTKTNSEVVNAVTDAQRLVQGFREVMAKVNPEANKVK